MLKLWSLQETVHDGNQRYIKQRHKPTHGVAILVRCLLLIQILIKPVIANDVATFFSSMHKSHLIAHLFAGICRTTEISVGYSLQILGT